MKHKVRISATNLILKDENPEEEWVIQYGGKLVATLPKTEPKYERSKYRNKTPPSTREIKEVLNYLQDSI